jgi:hypothetical protein
MLKSGGGIALVAQQPNAQPSHLVLEHDAEKWRSVSRLREAVQAVCVCFSAAAGEGRSEKIMLKHQAKAKY